MNNAWFRRCVVASLAAAAAYSFLPHGGLVYDGWYIIFALWAVLAIAAGAIVNAPAARAPWLLLAGGQLLFLGGDVVYAVYALTGSAVPYISPADAFYLPGYPLIAAGLFGLIRRRTPSREPATVVDAAIVTTCGALLMWIFLIEPYAGDPTLSAAQKLISTSYPLMDILLLTMAARMLVGRGVRLPAFRLLGGAVILQLAGDVLYGLGTLQGWYMDGHLLDLLFVAAYLAWGFSALHPSMVVLTEEAPVSQAELGWHRLTLVTLAALLIPVMLLFDSLRRIETDLIAMVIACAVLLGLAVARLFLVVANHKRALLREAKLRGAAAELVAASSRSEIHRIAVEAAVGLTEGRHGATTQAALTVGAAEAMTVVAATGPRAGAMLGSDLQRDLPASAMERLQEGHVAHLRGPDTLTIGDVGPKELIAVFPLVKHDVLTGALWIRQTGASLSVHEHGLQTLMSQIALALDRVALTEDAIERTSERRFRTLIQNSLDLIAVLESDLTIRYVTPSAESMLGWKPELLMGTNLALLLHPKESADVLGLSDAAGGSHPRELRFRCSDGGWRTAETVWRDLSDDPDVGGIVVSAHDVTERKALESQLTHQAFHDPLTGLANRALFADRVSHALDRAMRMGAQPAVLFIDLDDFKTVNDSLGHAAGDELLTLVAERIEGALRLGDTCARLGGDEFGVLLETMRDTEDAVALARRLTGALEDPFSVAGSVVYAPASVGIALGTSAANASELLRNADAAMYRAKTAKRSIEVFEPGMHEAARERLELRARLERAISNNEFVMHYQPIVELETGGLVALEGLVRWSQPERGLLPPATFIKVAEETGVIRRLGRAVLEQACRDAAAWRREVDGAKHLRLAVNISRQQLDDPDFSHEVAEVLATNGLHPSTLQLEIGERSIMSEREDAIAGLTRLKQLGVTIAIDDFGTGLSSLDYLHRFPVDAIKVAKQFVDCVGRGSDHSRLAAAIVSLGDSLGLETIAEGIELVSQREELRALGCTLGQGFFFSRPLPDDEITAYLSRSLEAAA